MQGASISENKRELGNLDESELLSLCLKLAKYKKDNKEMLAYLLFEAADEEAYVKKVKLEIDEQYQQINKSNLYWAKKSLRKILRTTNKYIRYSGNKQTEADLLLYFCFKLKTSGIAYKGSTALNNLFHQQIKKIHKAIGGFHEDLQYDYHREIESLV